MKQECNKVYLAEKTLSLKTDENPSHFQQSLPDRLQTKRHDDMIKRDVQENEDFQSTLQKIVWGQEPEEIIPLVLERDSNLSEKEEEEVV